MTFTFRRIATAALSLLLISSLAAPALAQGSLFGKKPGGGQFQGKLYDSCATKESMFSIMRNAGLKPERIIGANPGFVIIRGRGPDGRWDYVFVPCLFMVDGRFPVGKAPLNES
jgi:hypothetical protein